MKRFSFLVSLVFIITISHAQIPRIINYQGVLLGQNEIPVSEGDYKLTFHLYDEGNSLVWSEVHNSVYVVGGMFHVLLGIVNPLGIPFDKPYFLGIKVGDDTELQPRMMMTSAAYSLNSERIGGYGVNSTPTPNKLLPLDGSGKIPVGALPSASPSGEYLSKNIPDSTKGSSDSEMLRVENSGTGRGMTVMSSGSHGVYGKSTSSFAGVEGEGSGTGPGIRGSSSNNHGAIGFSVASDKAGVYGNNTAGIGVWGDSQTYLGVYGKSISGRGVYGESTHGIAVQGRSNENDGLVGWTNSPSKSGVFGNTPFGNGVTGISDAKDGILGVTKSSNEGHAGIHARNEGSGPAIFSEGDLYTTGKVYGNIGPSKGGPFPRPAYNSGWILVRSPAEFTLNVDQFLPTSQYDNDNFFIDMMTKSLGVGAGNLYVGESEDDTGSLTIYGTAYEIENDNSIIVRVRSRKITRVRIRVWYIK